MKSLLSEPIVMSDKPQNEPRIRAEQISRVSEIINKNVPVEKQLRGLATIPKTIDEQDQLAVEMIEWAEKETSYYLEEFPLSKRLNPYKFFKLRDKNEFFAECLQIAQYLCGLHLKRLVHTREVPHQYVLALLPTYNPEFKQLLTERWNKVEEHIKQQHSFACTWLDDLKKEPNGSNTDQQLPATTLPEELPQSTPD